METYRVVIDRWVLERGELRIRAEDVDEAIRVATGVAHHEDVDAPRGGWRRIRVVRVKPWSLAEAVPT